MFSTIKTYNSTTSCCNNIQSLFASVNPQPETSNSQPETSNSQPETKNYRYYLGKYEKEINHTTNITTEYYYVGGPMGNIAVYISENGAEPELFYTITDHLSSIVAIADEDGDILEEQRYDPCSVKLEFCELFFYSETKHKVELIPSSETNREGQYRNSITGEPEETPQLTKLFRGYTGHVQRNTVFESEANQKQIVEQIPMTKEIGKMLPEFGLINMFSEDNSFVNLSATKLFVELIPTESGNGRLYDPVIARVLSPDNYVQNPYNPQNYNRYSYCYNNPLVYLDPSGDFITWSVGSGGASFGINLAPGGIPFGAGINIGWEDGFSLGVYGEVGPRYGGTGLGAGATQTYSINYNFKHKSASYSVSVGTYATLGPISVGGSYSTTKYFGDKASYDSYGVYAGIGIGFKDGKGGLSATVGYGSGGWNYGAGGNYNPNYNSVSSIPEFELGGDGTPLPGSVSSETASAFIGDYMSAFTNVKGFDNMSLIIGELPAGFTYVPGEISFSLDRGISTKFGQVFDSNGYPALGATDMATLNVYLFPGAFQSKEHLFIVLGHESIHVAHFSSVLKFSPRKGEAAASWYNVIQGTAWNYRADYTLYHFEKNFNRVSPRYHHSTLNVPILYIKPW